MPRYVILWHEAGPALNRPSHFDLLFEEMSDARAWFVEQVVVSGTELAAEELPRHRLHYLTYEGPISRDRGAVSRWDHGEYRLLHASEDHFEVHLHGQRLEGTLQLARRAQKKWRLLFKAANSNVPSPPRTRRGRGSG